MFLFYGLMIFFLSLLEFLLCVCVSMFLVCVYHVVHKGFPHSSVGKESACNTGGPSLIPELDRCPGEEKGYPLQYSGLENSLGSQRVKHD